MRESKEKIKSRMIKNASRLWGFQDTQPESAFDPFVGMIFGALAGELEKVSGQIADTESRVVEKLVELLTPEPIIGPIPSHGLMRAYPSQSTFTIGSNYQFYLYKKMLFEGAQDRAEEKSVFFTPTGNYKLFQGNVEYIVTDPKLFHIENSLFKDLLAESEIKKPKANSTLWIGIKINNQVQSLNGLSFYFDMRNEANQQEFYQIISKTKWSFHGKKLNVIKGFGSGIKTEHSELDSMLVQDMDTTSKICNHVNHFYQDQFVTIADTNEEIKELKVENYPEEFKDLYSPEILQQLNKPILWIKIEFPNVFKGGVLEDVHCSINCFPVINRKLNSFTQTSRDFINIIPLQTEDTFLDMKEVTNSERKTYTQKFFTSRGELTKGSYILRQGGVGRFDSRDASEMMHYLLELLRDESAAFAVLGSDMISSNIRELNQTIARLEQRLNEIHTPKEKTSYLMLKSRTEDDIVFVEFWSSLGTFANHIKVGSKLSVYEGSDVMPDSVSLVTSTVGGKDSMNTEQRMNTYRRNLLSHGRVVTKEDIKTLCYEHFGNVIENIEVKKGMKQGTEPRQGFMQTMDIHIILDNRKASFSSEELSFLKKDLILKLEQQSANILPYRCFVK